MSEDKTAKIRERVAKAFSKVNPPLECFVQMFQLPLDGFRQAILQFVGQTYPEERAIAAVKFAKEFVKHQKKGLLNPITEEELKIYGSELRALLDQQKSGDHFNRFRLLDLEYAAADDFLKANNGLLDLQAIEQTRQLQEQKLADFVLKNQYSDYFPQNFCTEQRLREVFAEINQQFIKQKKADAFMAARLTLLFEAVKNYVQIVVPELLNIPRNHKCENFNKCLRTYIVRHWAEFGDKIIDKLIGTVKIQAEPFEFQRTDEFCILLVNPVQPFERQTPRTVGELLAVCFLFAHLLGFKCEYNQQRIIGTEEQQQLIFPRLATESQVELAAAYMKMKAPK